MAASTTKPIVSKTSLSNKIIARKYRLVNKIGSGSFGHIFLGVTLDNLSTVAVKVEKATAKQSLLAREFRCYRILEGIVGIPRIYYFGTEHEHHVLVMDLLGDSLEQLFSLCKRRFSLKTVLMLYDQMITRLEHVHARGLVHRDIKPDNFVMGRNQQRFKLFLIDFGLSKRCIDTVSGRHILMNKNKTITGTARYASVNSHKGLELSRRDDLISLGYMLTYFNCGSLPWQGLAAENMQQRYEKILEIKLTSTTNDLCGNAPIEFGTFLNYSHCLTFEQTPNYQFMRTLFRTLFNSLHFQYDFDFDWSAQLQTRQKQHQQQQQPKKQQQQQQQQELQQNKQKQHEDILLSSITVVPLL